jgi:putative membrane protein
MLLTLQEAAAIEQRVAEFEAELGVEVVTVVARKSDVYPETVWKAFALGAALAGLGVAAADYLRPDWVTHGRVLSAVVAVLGTGAVCALAAVCVPAFARLFLREARATLETQQYAKAQFLEREVFATPERTALLFFVSLLERRVVILADSGIRAHVASTEWDPVIGRMTGPLRAGQTGDALLAGLGAASALLKSKGVPHGAGNAFGNRPLEAES